MMQRRSQPSRACSPTCASSPRGTPPCPPPPSPGPGGGGGAGRLPPHRRPLLLRLRDGDAASRQLLRVLLLRSHQRLLVGFPWSSLPHILPLRSYRLGGETGFSGCLSSAGF